MASGFAYVLKVVAKIVGVLIAFLVLLLVVIGVFIFATPSVKISSDLTASLIERYAPDELKIGFKSFTLEINKPHGQFFSKQFVLDASNLCVAYEKPAVDVCVEQIRVAVTAGFDGPREQGESRLMPRLMHIEPLMISGAVVHLDLTAFPPSKNNEPSHFDLLTFVRKDILPKWDVEGSRVQVLDFKIKTAPGTSFAAQFDLQPGSAEHVIEAILHEARSLEGPLRAEAKISIQRPRDWGAQAADGRQVSEHAWKVLADGDLRIDATREMTLKADADIAGFQDLNFRVQTIVRGLALIREARLEGRLKQDAFEGKASLKGGSEKSEIKVLDFVNCAITADLKKKNGGLRCGPQSLRVQIRQKSLRRPDLYVFAPELDFKVSNLNFGDTKSADFSLEILLDHLGILRLGTRVTGHFESSDKGGTKYSAKGRADLVVPMFLQIVDLLRRTPYAIPAPFNTLDGALGIQANVDFTEKGGAIDYQGVTRLDSDFQAMHLDVNGKTVLTRGASGALEPETDVTILISNLSISAPRFDLRAPPAFKPDGRFGPLNKKIVDERLADKPKPTSGRFRLHVKTTSDEAIHIATNLTKSAIPITLDATYDDRSMTKSPVTGSVQIGRVPVELFKRSAIVQNIRVDLLETGDNRLNGTIAINYGDYAITILLLGQVSDPQVRFVSDPPLDDDQIVSVLLFGRPQHELGDDEKSTVANTKTAMADAVLGLGSLYFLASTPIESVGYDPDSGRVIARVGLGGGASIELGAGSQDSGSGLGFRKRLSKDFLFRSDVETLGSTGQRTVSALIEWVKRF